MLKRKSIFAIITVMALLISVLSPVGIISAAETEGFSEAQIDSIIYNTVASFDYYNPADKTVAVTVNLRRGITAALNAEGYTVKWEYSMGAQDNANNFAYQSPMQGCVINVGDISRTIEGDNGFAAGIITVTDKTVTKTKAFAISVPAPQNEVYNYSTVSAASEFEVDKNGKVVMYYGVGGTAESPTTEAPEVLYFPEGAKSLQTHNFLSAGIDKTKIKAIIFPEGFELVKNQSVLSPVFKGWTGLEAVYCPETLTSFCAFPSTPTHPGQSGEAFNGCTSLKYVRLSDSMKILPFKTFMNCSSLVNVNIPSGLELFGGTVLGSNTMLRTALVLPGTITQFGNTIIAGKNVPDGLYVGALNAAHQYNSGTTYRTYGALFDISKRVFAGGTALADIEENENYSKTTYTAHADMTIPQLMLMVNGLLKYENTDALTNESVSELIGQYCNSETISCDVDLSRADSRIILSNDKVSMSFSDIGITAVGDANGDGTVNILDMIAVKKYIAGVSVSINEKAADLNDSGSVENGDLVLLRKYLLGVTAA